MKASLHQLLELELHAHLGCCATIEATKLVEIGVFTYIYVIGIEAVYTTVGCAYSRSHSYIVYLIKYLWLVQ